MAVLLVLSPIQRSEIRSELLKHFRSTNLMPEILLFKELNSVNGRSRLEEVDVVLGDITNQVNIDKPLISAMRNLRFIQLPNSDTGSVDMQLCSSLGIKIATCRGAYAYSAAEHCIAVALLLLKRIFLFHMNLLEGKWLDDGIMDISTELKSKTWGMIGFNETSISLSKLLSKLNVRVYYYDVNRLDTKQENRLHIRYMDLNQLLMESDVVSIHIDTPVQSTLIGEEQFRSMKPTAVLINPSQSDVVDESALAQALMNGMISGAYVEVYSREKLDTSNPLLLAAREGAPVILTPHTVTKTAEARRRIISACVANIARFLKGLEPFDIIKGY